jgi:hypothetical protein
MSRIFLLASLLLILTGAGYSQDFLIQQKNLIPVKFNTTRDSILIYELPNVKLYFKQRDIIEYIQNPKNETIIGPGSYRRLLDTLQTRTRIIRVQSIPDYTNQIEFDSLIRIYGDSTKLLEINTQLYVIGAALMLNGNFMLYSNKKKVFITKGLFAESSEGVEGRRTLEFYLPDKEKFYDIITRSADN